MMKELIKRNIDFFCWENFINLNIYINWFFSLVIITAFIFLSILISFVLIKNKKTLFNNKIEEIVFRFGFGISILTFILIFLGLFGFLNKYIFLIFVIVILVLIKNKKGTIIYLCVNIRLIIKQYPILFIIFILVSMSSLLPPFKFDEISYHLPYVMQWVNNGSFTVDPFMRYPLYTFNFHSLHSIGFFLNSTNFNHLLTWSTGIFTSLSIIAFLERFNVNNYIKNIAAISFILTPLVQEFLNTAYIDVPLMFFTTLTAYSIILLENDKKISTILLSSLIVAMFLGMKITNIIYFPIILIIVFFNLDLKKFSIYTVILIMFGSVWYIRNLIIAGDPLPPIINFALGKSDIFWTKADYLGQIGDLKTNHNLGFAIIYKLPLAMISSNSFLRGIPLLSYVLIFPVSIMFFIKNLKNKEVLLLYIFTIYSILVWLSTSILIRYTYFTPLIIICSGLFISDVFNYKKYNKKIKIMYFSIVLSIFLGPGINAINSLKSNFHKKIPTNNEEINLFLNSDVTFIINQYNIQKNKRIVDEKIYNFGYYQYKYYFQKANLYSVGDWFHTYRYSDFYENYQNETIDLFFKNSEIKYLLVGNDEFLSLFNLNKERVFNKLKKQTYLNIIAENDNCILFEISN